MRLTHADVTPMLAIVFGAALGMVATASLTVSNGPHEMPSAEPVVAPSPLLELRAVPSSDDVSAATVRAIARIEELQQRQEVVRLRVAELPTESGEARTAALRELLEQKDRIHRSLEELERELTLDAMRAGPASPDLVANLRRAAELIGSSKLEEKVLYSRGTIEQWDRESALTLEVSIADDLQALRDSFERRPLVFVDGVQVPAMPDDLDPADIASIEVVKGARAIELYGEGASNGAVLISMKGDTPGR